MKISLGLLEVKGLALAINTADSMAKCAAVNIVEIEKTNGGGWMMIKITGDVSAVQSAISTGASLAEKHSGLVSHKVISRPDQQLLNAINTTVKKPKVPALPIESVEPQVEVTTDQPADTLDNTDIDNDTQQNQLSAETSMEDISNQDLASDEQEHNQPLEPTCNICQDPACPRIKGEPHGNCINKGKKND
ncbi:BMC domain-containing protein [Vibrio sp. MA40-2]|uniref:BMC domain-containing protein n=1 Tax=Vibrio sp. MA40-2 TaxID=3391828 RepID=UPI0039A75A72